MTFDLIIDISKEGRQSSRFFFLQKTANWLLYSTPGKNKCRICSSLIDNHDDLEQVPWPDVVQALIDYMLGLRPTYDPFSSNGADIVVVYFALHLNNFKAKHKTTSTHEKEQQRLQKHLGHQVVHQHMDHQ